MQFIEVSDNTFVAVSQIVKVILSTYEERSKAQDVGYEQKSTPRKIGEKFKLEITTSDGSKHGLNEERSEEAYRILFPE